MLNQPAIYVRFQQELAEAKLTSRHFLLKPGRVEGESCILRQPRFYRIEG